MGPRKVGSNTGITKRILGLSISSGHYSSVRHKIFENAREKVARNNALKARVSSLIGHHIPPDSPDGTAPFAGHTLADIRKVAENLRYPAGAIDLLACRGTCASSSRRASDGRGPGGPGEDNPERLRNEVALVTLGGSGKMTQCRLNRGGNPFAKSVFLTIALV